VFCRFVADVSKPQDNATIKGRVTASGKGLAHCLVTIWKAPYTEPPQGSPATKTDLDGNFRIGVPPGSYFAWVSAPGFFVVADGKPSQELHVLTVSAGDESDAVNFEVERGGIVTGRVTSNDDKPVIEIPVTLIPTEPSPPRIFAFSSSVLTGERTDDRGIYRIYGVPPGSYHVAAGDTLPAYASMRGGKALRRVFYPDVFEERKGKQITVKPGTELSGIDIKMGPPEPVFSVSGRIIDEASGEPVANLSVGLVIYSGDKRIGGRGGSDFSGQRGDFKIENIPAGRYSVYAPGSFSTSSPSLPDYFGDSERFEIVDQDVTGIIVKTARTGSVSGSVVLENASDKTVTRKLQQLRFNVTSMPKTPGRVSAKSFSVGPEGTFTVNGLMPGVVNFNVNTSTSTEMQPFRILRVEFNNNDQPVEIKAGENITGLKVVLAYATASLRGTISFANGNTPAKIRGTAGLYKGQIVVGWSAIDERGTFVMESIPAGNYRLIVMVGVPGPKPQTARSEQMIDVNEHQALRLWCRLILSRIHLSLLPILSVSAEPTCSSFHVVRSGEVKALTLCKSAC
jgi:hypothetical protein